MPRQHMRLESSAAAAHHEEGWVSARDGLQIYWQGWVPTPRAQGDRVQEGAPGFTSGAPKDPRGVLLFVHGLGEHSGRYVGPASHFFERGYACYALDYRAHGRSPGTKVHVDHFDHFLLDLQAMRTLVTARHPGQPLFLVGHSQGGLLVLLDALRAPAGLAGIALSSPFLGIHPTSRPGRARASLARVLTRLTPWVRLPNGLDARWLSRDAAVVDAYGRDPLVSHHVSVRWFTAAGDALRQAHAQAPSLRVPALILIASADQLVDPEATRRLARTLPSGLAEVVEWDGCYHELFNEPEKEQVFLRLEQWLEPRRNVAQNTLNLK